MKTIAIVVGFAFLVVGGVMFSLIKKGGALKPAGVIKPAEIGNDSTLIGRQVAVRLFPAFHEAKQVIWRVESEALVEIVHVAFANYGGPIKPRLIDLRGGREGAECTEHCWYLLNLDETLPAAKNPVEIWVQYFQRDIEVPEACENQKILTVECMKPICVREVRRKIRTPAPHFFMQRYQDSEFYLYLERAI